MARTLIDLETQSKDQSLVTGKIKDGAVVESKITDSAVTTNKIADSAVATAKLSDNAVTTLKLADNAVTEAKIFDGAVTANKIANGAIVESKIFDGAVTSNKIALGVISNSHISTSASIDISKLNTTNADFDSTGVLKAGVVGDTKVSALSISKITNLQTELDARLLKAGDSMTGNLAMNGNKIIGLGSPTNANDAVTKNYVDSLASGITWVAPVNDIVAESNLPTSPNVGDRYLINNGTHVYIIAKWNGSSWDFVTPSDDWSLFVKNGEVGYVYDADSTETFKWVQFTGTGQITAGIGLEKVGNVLNVKLGVGITELPTDEVGLDLASNGALGLTSLDSSGQLKVNIDGTTVKINANNQLYVDSNVLLPTGTLGQTLRHDGTSWVTNSFLYNNGTSIGIGTTTPSATLEVNGNIKASGLILGSNTVQGGVSQLDRFTADGNTTTFTLSSTPIDQRILVYLNGVLQWMGATDDYTINSNQVVFTFAPANGDRIQILYYRSA